MLNPVPVSPQPVWQRFMSQAIDFKQSISETLTQAVDDVKVHAEAYWQDTIDYLTGDSPVIVPLVDKSPGAESAQPPKITVGSRVLIIGDSQTVGPYGKTIDELARATGATVSTHASWGASPPWYFSGQDTYKYWTHDSAGHEETRMNTATPKLNELLAAERPDVVVVTMGGNMIASNASQADVTMQVSQIGNAVTASGAELIWVGPPKYDPQKRTPELVDQFYQKLENIVPEFGSLIDSRPHISEYAGTDGLHYSGNKGEKIARQWANGVFQDIQKLD
jgi:lysophospholipase L1-like esterase